ncbi:MAG TPA: VWA domain-containing protein [Paludibacteraceae bacterium]|nr:VWA domain-containing protein [Paludibacteraceae bacterium]HQB68545.1 VWA domain-containing protein [Paludibacteraceae bacterium]HRS67046.1 VWA domain-containing protein [Paludibacteraceae bacterium]
MFRFANPNFLYLLIVVPLLVAMFVYVTYQQKKRLSEFGNPDLLRRLIPNVSTIRPQLKFYMLMVVLVLMIVALARPQFGSKLQTIKKQGVEAVIVLDVSNSMMAQDVQPNRLERSKLIMSKLIDDMVDDKVGLIVFAGDAFVQLPITSDNVSAKMFLSSINPNLVPRQGTAIGTAIDLAIRSFGPNESEAGRTIIVITDGENHEDDAIGAAKLAREKGITVHVIGMGTPEGTPIPVAGTMSFRKDKDGNVVITKLNEVMCQQIAEAGSGIYVRADNTNTALKAISGQINDMQKGNLETKSYAEYDEKFFIFVWIAFFLLIVEFYLFNRQNKALNKIKWFD